MYYKILPRISLYTRNIFQIFLQLLLELPAAGTLLANDHGHDVAVVGDGLLTGEIQLLEEIDGLADLVGVAEDLDLAADAAAGITTLTAALASGQVDDGTELVLELAGEVSGVEQMGHHIRGEIEGACGDVVTGGDLVEGDLLELGDLRQERDLGLLGLVGLHALADRLQLLLDLGASLLESGELLPLDGRGAVSLHLGVHLRVLIGVHVLEVPGKGSGAGASRLGTLVERELIIDVAEATVDLATDLATIRGGGEFTLGLALNLFELLLEGVKVALLLLGGVVDVGGLFCGERCSFFCKAETAVRVTLTTARGLLLLGLVVRNFLDDGLRGRRGALLLT